MDKNKMLERALLIGEWLVRNQVKNPFDANCGRGIDHYDAKTGYLYQTVNWTTGLMTAVLCALHKRTGDKKFLDAAVRAGKYILSLQLLDQRRPEYYGLYREIMPQSVECAPRDATSAAWGLVWLYNSTGDRVFLESAKIFAEWHMNYAMIDGWPRYALYMSDLPDFYAQGSFQSGTGLFYHDLFMASGDARLVERGLRPIAYNYRDRFFNPDDSLILERDAFSGTKHEPEPGIKMHAYNDDFGGAMLQTAADFFNDESFREKAKAYALWLCRNQDADGGFEAGKVPSGVPSSLMYYHDLGTFYNDAALLNARDKTLDKLFSMQHIDIGESRLDGGIEGLHPAIGKWPEITNAPRKHVTARSTLYACMAFLKMESELEDIWLGRHNKKWIDPLHDADDQAVMKSLGYLVWNEAR